jgi:hypothetical protein
VLIDPSLPLVGRHLLGIEPGDLRCDLGEELEEPGGKLGRAGVAKEDQHLGSVAKVCGDPSEEPTLFGSARRGGKGLAHRDKLAGERLGVADLEGKLIVGGTVEIGGKLDESVEETAGALWNEAVGPDSSEKLVLKAVVLSEEPSGLGIIFVGDPNRPAKGVLRAGAPRLPERVGGEKSQELNGEDSSLRVSLLLRIGPQQEGREVHCAPRSSCGLGEERISVALTTREARHGLFAGGVLNLSCCWAVERSGGVSAGWRDESRAEMERLRAT